MYAKEDCSIPAGMGKYIPVQTNCEITGEVLIAVDDKTIHRLVLPEVVYNIKKKLGWIFVENHNLESMVLRFLRAWGNPSQYRRIVRLQKLNLKRKKCDLGN